LCPIEQTKTAGVPASGGASGTARNTKGRGAKNMQPHALTAASEAAAAAAPQTSVAKTANSPADPTTKHAVEKKPDATKGSASLAESKDGGAGKPQPEQHQQSKSKRGGKRNEAKAPAPASAGAGIGGAGTSLNGTAPAPTVSSAAVVTPASESAGKPASAGKRGQGKASQAKGAQPNAQQQQQQQQNAAPIANKVVPPPEPDSKQQQVSQGKGNRDNKRSKGSKVFQILRSVSCLSVCTVAFHVTV